MSFSLEADFSHKKNEFQVYLSSYDKCTRSGDVFPMKPGDSVTDFETDDAPIAAGPIGEEDLKSVVL